MSERCQHADTVAAFLLGALSEDERTLFAAHLAGCADCREDIATLGIVVDALPSAAPQVDPPPQLRERVLDTVRSEADVLNAAGPAADRPRRSRLRAGPWRSRPLALAGMAAAALLLAGLAGFGLRAATESGGGSKQAVAVRTVPAQIDQAAAPGASAHVVVRGGVATLVVTGLPAPPPGHVYQVWLKRPGVAAPAPTNALFGVDHRGGGEVAVPSVNDVEAVLVTAEPNGGSPAPTRQPVIVAPLS